MEEPPVEAAGLELAHRPVVAVGQDRLRTVGRAGDRGELLSDRVQGLVPADPLEPPFALCGRPASSAAASDRGCRPARDTGPSSGTRNPRVNACSGSPLSSIATPSSTVTRMLHVSGQSSGQTFLTTVSAGWFSTVATANDSRPARTKREISTKTILIVGVDPHNRKEPNVYDRSLNGRRSPPFRTRLRVPSHQRSNSCAPRRCSCSSTDGKPSIIVPWQAARRMP